MKKIIYIIIVFFLMGTSSLWADEIVLKTGEIISGNVLDLTENTIRMDVDGKEMEVDRTSIEAAFLGRQATFSTRGYPLKPDVKTDEQDE